MEKDAGKLIVLVGMVIIILGIVGGGWPATSCRFLGHLPGDINIKGDNWRVFIPVTTMILVSIVLSLVFWVLGKVGR